MGYRHVQPGESQPRPRNLYSSQLHFHESSRLLTHSYAFLKASPIVPLPYRGLGEWMKGRWIFDYPQRFEGFSWLAAGDDSLTRVVI